VIVVPEEKTLGSSVYMMVESEVIMLVVRLLFPLGHCISWVEGLQDSRTR